MGQELTLTVMESLSLGDDQTPSTYVHIHATFLTKRVHLASARSTLRRIHAAYLLGCGTCIQPWLAESNHLLCFQPPTSALSSIHLSFIPSLSLPFSSVGHQI